MDASETRAVRVQSQTRAREGRYCGHAREIVASEGSHLVCARHPRTLK